LIAADKTVRKRSTGGGRESGAALLDELAEGGGEAVEPP